jgi:hypothetical protein
MGERVPRRRKSLSAKERAAIISFLAWAFWIVGTVCVLWESIVIVGIYRDSSITLPLFGTASPGEAINFILSFFWAPLVALHCIAHKHQSLTTGKSWSERFPGLIKDKDIPNPMGYLRFLLFVILLVWPSFAHVVVTVRSFTDMSIVYDYHGEAYLLPSDGRRDTKEKANTDELEYRGLPQLRWLSQPRNTIGGEWRWLHWRDKKDHVLLLPADELRPTGYGIHPEHWPTAIPIIQPWGFLLVAVGLTISTGVLLIRPLPRRPWLFLLHHLKRSRPRLRKAGSFGKANLRKRRPSEH